MPMTAGPCDCLNHCGDDPQLATGAARPCASEEARRAQTERVARALERAWRLADAAAISDIESFAHPVLVDDRRWYDTRVMLDEREYPGELRDLAQLAIEHAVDRKLFERHPQTPALLRRRVTP